MFCLRSHWYITYIKSLVYQVYQLKFPDSQVTEQSTLHYGLGFEPSRPRVE